MAKKAKKKAVVVVKKKTPKKKGALSALARGALAGGAFAADRIAPGSGTLVNILGKGLLNKLGLSEKIVVPDDYANGFHSGGAIVQTADAPVAFSRQQITAADMKILHTAHNGDVILAGHEFWDDVTTAGTASTFLQEVQAIYPTSSSFSLLAQVAKGFQYHRPLKLTFHYTHWAATSEVARVALVGSMSCANTAGNMGIGTTFLSESMMEHFAAGSCYEDFALEVTFEDLQLNWYNNWPSIGASFNLKSPFVFAWSTDLNASTSKTVGSIFIEYVWAFHYTRDPSVTAGVALSAFGLCKDETELRRILDRVIWFRAKYGENEIRKLLRPRSIETIEDVLLASSDNFDKAIQLYEREHQSRDLPLVTNDVTAVTPTVVATSPPVVLPTGIAASQLARGAGYPRN
jgi:hypothetical protein